MSEFEPIAEGWRHSIRQYISALIEQRLHSLSDYRRDWKHYAIIALLNCVFGYLLIFSTWGSAWLWARFAENDALDHLTQHPLFWFSPLVVATFGLLFTAFIAWRRYFSTLDKETRKAFMLIQADRIPELASAFGGAEPFKTIRESLQPPNSQLEAAISRLSGETFTKIKILQGLYLLPDRVRECLSAFIEKLSTSYWSGSHEPEWKQLYLTFAINLQLDPWITLDLFRREKFTFVRDKESLRCHFDDKNALDDAFNARLDEDLAEILYLVNGSIFTVMYRDVQAWENVEFIDANDELIRRKTEEGRCSDLRRLFIYEPNWLNFADQRYVQILIGALWHADRKYPAKFIAASQDMKRIIKKSDKTFLASCVLNRTVMRMSASPAISDEEKRTFNRYLYSCDSDLTVYQGYKAEFEKFWNMDIAVEPQAFLDCSDSAALEAARTKYGRLSQATGKISTIGAEAMRMDAAQ